MLKKTLFTLTVLLAATSVAQAQSSPAKKDLVAKILKVQQPGIEAMARSLVEQPAAELMGSAGEAMQVRVAKDKQEAVGKEIHADVQKYLDETVPVVRDRAIRLAPSTVGTLLEEKFNEDELKQVISILESPAYAKYQQLGEEMQKVLVEKLIADTRTAVEPKVRALEQTIGKRLGVTAPPAATSGAAPAARPPARPASK